MSFSDANIISAVKLSLFNVDLYLFMTLLSFEKALSAELFVLGMVKYILCAIYKLGKT
jgi:hypothetical protein